MTLKIVDKKLLCQLKSKIKKIIWTKLYFRQFYFILFHLNYRGLFVDKGSGSGSGIFPDPDPDPGDQKRPDPTGSESATLPNSIVFIGYVKALEAEINKN